MSINVKVKVAIWDDERTNERTNEFPIFRGISQAARKPPLSCAQVRLGGWLWTLGGDL